MDLLSVIIGALISTPMVGAFAYKHGYNSGLDTGHKCMADTILNILVDTGHAYIIPEISEAAKQQDQERRP